MLTHDKKRAGAQPQVNRTA